MKTIAKSLLLICFSWLFSASVIAGGDFGWRKIESIVQRECTANKGLEVTFTSAHRNPDFCSRNRSVEISCGLANYKQLLAMVLTAQSANMDVAGYVSGCDADGQAKIKTIKIR